MIPEQLEQIRARLEAATPGPWREFAESGDFWIERADADGNPIGPGVCSNSASFYNQADCVLVEHAPADIACLLDEVRRLYAVIDQSISDVQGISNLAGDDVPGLREMIHHLADQLGAALEGK